MGCWEHKDNVSMFLYLLSLIMYANVLETWAMIQYKDVILPV